MFTEQTFLFFPKVGYVTFIHRRCCQTGGYLTNLLMTYRTASICRAKCTALEFTNRDHYENQFARPEEIVTTVNELELETFSELSVQQNSRTTSLLDLNQCVSSIYWTCFPGNDHSRKVDEYSHFSINELLLWQMTIDNVYIFDYFASNWHNTSKSFFIFHLGGRSSAK